MKKFLLFVVILLINNYYLFSKSFFDDLIVKRISTDFNGSAYNGSSILAYGEGGIILRSTSGGATWEQINLNDSINIIDIINIGSKYYGISSKKYIITSNNNGVYWNYLDLGDNLKLYKILTNGENLYAISNAKIFVFNQNLEKLKEYTVSIDTTYYDGVIASNKLFYPKGKGIIGYINLNNDQQGIIDLEALGVCNDCEIPTKIISNNENLIYFLMGAYLYQYDLNTNSAKYLYKPSKIVNGAFATKLSNVYNIYSINYILQKIDSLFFIKADKENNKAINIKSSGNDRYINDLKFTSLKFISTDTVIAVGKGKLIYMSYNGGVRWELKCLFNDMLNNLYVFDKLNCRMISNDYHKFIYTNDGGITWLPQKDYPEIFLEEENFDYPDIAFFKDKNNGMVLASPYLLSGEINAVITKDGGNNIFLKDLRKIYQFSDFFFPQVTDYKSKYLITTHRDINDTIYVIFDILNNNFEIEKNSYVKHKACYFIDDFNDTIYSICDDTDKKDNILRLYYSTDGTTTWKEDFSFAYDSNYLAMNLVYLYNRIGNKIFLYMAYTNSNNESVYYKIYSLDIIKKEFKEIVSNNMYYYPYFFKINNKFAYFNYIEKNNRYVTEINYTEDIDTEPIIWQKEQINRFSDHVLMYKYAISDSLIGICAFDPIYKSNEVFFIEAKNSTNVKQELSTEVIQPIYITKPSPIPANSGVKMKVYWDQQLNFDNVYFQAYNLLGIPVSNKSDFIFSKYNSYSGELVWHPQNLPSGVYFIVVSIGDISKSTVVIIEK